MISDLLEKNNTHENETQKKPVKPSPKMDIHTIMGDMRRWFEGDLIYWDYKVDKKKYLILEKYYKEKEGITDGK